MLHLQVEPTARLVGYRTKVLVAGMLMVVLGVVMPGMAQVWTGWGVDVYRKPLISSRGLKEIVQKTGMSEEQRRAAEQLLTAYLAEHQVLVSRADEVRDYVQNDSHLNQVETNEWYELSYEVNRRTAAKADALNNGLIDDFRAIMSAEQLQRFERVERALRRERLLRMAERGSNTLPELTELLRAMSLSEPVIEAIDPSLRAYEEELDRELQAFGERREGYLKVWDGLIGTYTGSTDQVPQSLRDTANELNESLGRILVIRRRHLELIREAVPAAYRAGFDDALNRRLFPQVYRMTRIARILEAAVNYESLDESTRSTVREIKESYERDAAPATKRWLETLDAEHRALCFREGAQEARTKMHEAFAARQAVDKAALGRLNALLSKEQQREISMRANARSLDMDLPPADPQTR